VCDEKTQADANAYRRRAGDLSRREFAALSVGAGLAMVLPKVAGAVEVTGANVDIKTQDGVADCFFVHPKAGLHPGVIVWPDAFGLRTAYRQMATRLAESGYSVLVVNPYYRVSKAPGIPEGSTINDPATRPLLAKLMPSLNATTHVTDSRTFVAWLDTQTSVDKDRKMAVTGYCMGGPIVMRAAAAMPERIGAGATFHGGGMATNAPDSPHLLVPKMKAQFLFAIAESDDKRDPEQKNLLRKAYANGKLPAEIEVYAGTQHGWCPPDSDVYNQSQADRAWERQLALFKTALG
jgi:carboxymethylenebutenolidase